jgi:ubiquinone/menaquinone biosynthesis C-methylase UbiE
MLSPVPHWSSKVLLTSVRLDIYSQLSGGPKTAGQVARRIGADPNALTVLLNALVALGLLQRRRNYYVNNPLSTRWLDSASPEYAGHQLLCEDRWWKLWDRLERRVLRGRPVLRRSVFHQDPKTTEELLLGLHRDALALAPRLVQRLPFLAQAESVLDVGGGSGTFSIAFCKAYPRLRATVVDLPYALAVARRVVAKAGMGRRVELVPCDVLKEPLPGQHTVVFISNLLHNFSPGQSQRLLRKSWQALHRGGWIVLRDVLLNEDRVSPAWGALFSVNMLLHSPHGRCYSRGEVTRWLEQAGFQEVREVQRNEVLVARKA